MDILKKGEYMQSLDQIWDSVLDILEKNCNKSVYDLWFADTKLIYLDSDKAAITINSDLKKNIIAKRYVTQMIEALAEVIGFELPLEIYSDEHGPVDLQIIHQNEEEREKVLAGWHKAVSRSMKWIEADE